MPIQEARPILLSYEARSRRRLRALPWLVAAVHCAVTYPLWWWAWDKLMRDIIRNYRPIPPVPPSAIERAGELLLSVLMLPMRELWWPNVGLRPWFFVGANSVCWGAACWLVFRFCRRN
jgi:hypothetical protein